MFNQEALYLDIFKGLDQKQLKYIQPLVEKLSFNADQAIFCQGQPALYFYILLSGKVEINHKPYDGTQLTVAHILPGGIFGWSAALGRETYTSGANAVVQSEAYRLKRSQIQKFYLKRPAVGEQFLERLANALGERLPITPNQILAMLKNGMEVKGNI